MEFSLFYFADESHSDAQRYHLLLEGARYADTHGFSAVWTPERHFHPFGGLYPNPAVAGAAVAAVTQRVAVRAGSVVAPLHHPARIAEEWSVVDNISGGRAGIALASGWHVQDFTLRPETYDNRKEFVLKTAETVQRLWRGESVTFLDGQGNPAELRTFPSPVQPALPMWFTSAGSASTFRAAGEFGAGVLTHLLGQDLPDLERKIKEYRTAFTLHHPERLGQAHVALMLHTLLGPDRDLVREQVREPFTAYLRSSLGLQTLAAGLDPAQLSPTDLDFLVARSFDRYFDTGGLFGPVDDGVKMVERLEQIGIDEIACLIDFLPAQLVLDSLDHVDELRRAVQPAKP